MSETGPPDLAALRIPREMPAPPSRGRRYLAVLVVALMVASTSAVLLSSRPPPVRLGMIEHRTTAPSSQPRLTATGYIVARRTSRLGAAVSGRIAAVHIREGDSVKADQVLVELDSTETKRTIRATSTRAAAAALRLKVSEAELTEAIDKWKRAEKLAEHGASPKATADDLGQRVTTLRATKRARAEEASAARADVEVLQTRLADHEIRAPFTGIIASTPLQIGEVVSPGTPVVDLYDRRSLVVEVDVPELQLSKVATGAPCLVTLDAFADQPLSGRVLDVAPTFDRAKATARVRVGLSDAYRAHPGMAARVRFLSADSSSNVIGEEVTTVPATAVVVRDSQRWVFVMNDGTAHAHAVTTGPTIGDRLVLESGPPPGIPVVLNPPASLEDGDPIQEQSP